MDAASGPPVSYELADYSALARRHWWVLSLGIVVGLALAILYLQVAPKEYTSTASVLVTPTGAEQATNATNGRTDDVINLDTEAQLVRSAVVAGAVQKQLSSPLPLQEIVERVQVTVPPNTSVLDITYTAASPGGAQRGARAFAQAYLENRTATATQSTSRRVAALQKQIAGANKTLKTLAGQIASLAENSPDRFTAQAQQRVVQDSLTIYNQRLSPLLSTDITPGRVITDAALPSSPSKPSRTVVLGSGLLVGLVLGLGVALLRERLDHRVRRAADVERLGDLPVLLEVPRSGKGPTGLLSFHSEGGQAFRRLRNDVVAAMHESSQVILVTGASGGHASGAVAANLAAALARTEERVVLLCADMRSADAASLLGVPVHPGLSDVLLERLPAASVVHGSSAAPGLSVLSPGADGALAGDRLQTEAMEQLVVSLREVATYVVVEAPPTSSGADAQALAQLVDAAILVVESRRTLREEILEGALQIDRMATPLLGVVIVPHQGRAGRQSAVPARADRSAEPQAVPAVEEPATPELTAPAAAPVPEQAARSGQEDDRSGDVTEQEAQPAGPPRRAVGTAVAEGSVARDRVNGTTVLQRGGATVAGQEARRPRPTRDAPTPRSATDSTVDMPAVVADRFVQKVTRPAAPENGSAPTSGR